MGPDFQLHDIKPEMISVHCPVSDPHLFNIACRIGLGYFYPIIWIVAQADLFVWIFIVVVVNKTSNLIYGEGCGSFIDGLGTADSAH